MKIKTYFYIHHTGKVYRKDVSSDEYSLISQGMHRIAAQSNQIIVVDEHGNGKTVKNRYAEEPQHFSQKEMVFLSLKATYL